MAVPWKTDEILCVLVNITFHIIVNSACNDNILNFCKKKKCNKTLFRDAFPNINSHHNINFKDNRCDDEQREL